MEKKYRIVINIVIAFFQNATDRWTFIYDDIHANNFYVTKNGMVYLIDAEDIIVIDRKSHPPGQGNSTIKKYLVTLHALRVILLLVCAYMYVFVIFNMEPHADYFWPRPEWF